MLEIINYINSKNEEITIRYDEKLERVIYWNLDTRELKEIRENLIEDIKTTILDIVCSDIMELNYISEIFTIDEEILESFESNNKNLFIEELKKFNIEVE